MAKNKISSRQELWSARFKTFCIPESFNNNISHQFFEYTISLRIHSTRTQIQNMIFYKNSLHTQHEFLSFNNN